MGSIKTITSLLNVNTEAEVLDLALHALQAILRRGKDDFEEHLGLNPVVSAFDSLDGLDKLEALQEHPNADKNAQAVKLINDYFGV